MRRARRHWSVLASIALGGGLGSSARYLIGQAIPGTPGGFPWSTFLVNVTGCLTLGVLMVYVLDVWPPRRYVRPFAGIGFLGGFTTFSAYTSEIRHMDSLPLAAVYAVTSMFAGLAAVWLGMVVARFASRRG